jgi:hypothetical protein
VPLQAEVQQVCALCRLLANTDLQPRVLCCVSVSPVAQQFVVLPSPPPTSHILGYSRPPRQCSTMLVGIAWVSVHMQPHATCCVRTPHTHLRSPCDIPVHYDHITVQMMW